MKNKFLKRTSVRSFSKYDLSENEIKEIIDVINNSPTSTNGQQFSAVLVTDQKVLDRISELNWGQTYIKEGSGFISFFADNTRVKSVLDKNNVKFDSDIAVHEFIRGTIDATISATYVHDYLMTNGFGTCFIGGQVNYAEEATELLGIPEGATIVTAVLFGKTKNENDFKPKMNKVYLDKYDEDDAKNEVHKYIEDTTDYYGSRNRNDFGKQIIDWHIDSYMNKALKGASKYLEEKCKKHGK